MHSIFIYILYIDHIVYSLNVYILIAVCRSVYNDAMHAVALY
jgi:hypothetical protein